MSGRRGSPGDVRALPPPKRLRAVPTHLADAAMDPMLNDAELSPTPRVGRSTIDRSSNPSPHRPNLDCKLAAALSQESLACAFARTGTSGFLCPIEPGI